MFTQSNLQYLAGHAVTELFSRLYSFPFLTKMFVMHRLAFVAWNHSVDAKDADKSVILILKENNKVVAETLKESTERTNKILEKMNDTQQRTVEAIRESNCLLGLPQERRANAAEFCKRISR